MAGEFLMVNPRRKRRKTRAKAKPRKRRRRAVAKHNPHRRARRRRPARRRRAVHHNPRGLNLAGIDFGSAALTAGGFVGSDLAAGFLGKMLPPTWQSGAPKLVVKAVVGIGAPLLAKRFIGARVANLLAAGAAVSVLVDAYHLWIAPAIPGLSDYSLSAYEPAPGGSSLGADDNDDLGADDNMYANTMY